MNRLLHLTTFVFLGLATVAAAALSPENLRTEWLPNPLGSRRG